VEFKRPADVLEAVKSGKVDAGIGSTLITAPALEAGLAEPLFSNDLMPDHPCCRVICTSAVIREKRPALVALVKALLRAEKKFYEDPESAIRANVNQQQWKEEYARQTSLEPHVRFYVDPNSNAVAAMWKYMQATNYLDPSLTADPRSLIDTSIYLEALRALGKESPSPYWDKLEARFTEWNG